MKQQSQQMDSDLLTLEFRYCDTHLCECYSIRSEDVFRRRSSDLNCLFVLGWFARPVDKRGEKKNDLMQEFLDEIHAGNIKQHLRYTHISTHTL